MEMNHSNLFKATYGRNRSLFYHPDFSYLVSIKILLVLKIEDHDIILSFKEFCTKLTPLLH